MCSSRLYRYYVRQLRIYFGTSAFDQRTFVDALFAPHQFVENVLDDVKFVIVRSLWVSSLYIRSLYIRSLWQQIVVGPRDIFVQMDLSHDFLIFDLGFGPGPGSGPKMRPDLGSKLGSKLRPGLRSRLGPDLGLK